MGDRGSKLELEKAKLQFHHQKQEFKEQLAELASRIEHSHEPENDAQVQRQIKNTNNIQGLYFFNYHAGGGLILLTLAGGLCEDYLVLI